MISIFNNFELLDVLNLDELQFSDEPQTPTILAVVGEFALAGSAVLRKTSVLDPRIGAMAIAGEDALTKKTFYVSAADDSIAVTGCSADLKKEIPSLAGSISLSGQSATLAKTHLLKCDGDTISIEVSGVSMSKGARIAGGAGEVLLAGYAGTLSYRQEIASDGGSYDVSGVAAVLSAARRLAAAQGATVVSGIAPSPSLKGRRHISAGTGTFGISGQDAGKVLDRLVSASPASVSIEGSPALLLGTSTLGGETGEFGIAGASARLWLGYFRNMPSGPGAYDVAGPERLFRHTYRLQSEAGGFLVGGAPTLPVFHEIPSLHPSQIIPHVQEGSQVSRREAGASVSVIVPSIPSVTREATVGQTVSRLEPSAA